MQQPAGRYPPSSLLWQVEAEVEAIRRERSHGPPSFLSSKDLLDALCLHFNVMSFAELNLGAPFAVPAIRQVLDLEASLWDFVGIYVTSRAISTVNDAEAGFLELHRVPTFDALGLGTCFSLSPAVAYHFHVQGPPPIAPLSTKDVLLHLRDFRFVHNRQTQDPAIFLAYMAGAIQHPVGTLGVAVANMGRSIELMRRMYNEERKELRDLENDFRKDISARVFEITKTKFSAENREKAIGDALAAQHVALPEGNQKANVSARVASSLLTQITRLDAELDQEIARYRSRLPKNVASTIAAMDTKLRAKVVRKKMEKSRSATVSWVLCSIMAKARVLLDTDKLDSVHKGQQREAAAKDGDDDECKCCCVGKDACSCACTCKCHVIDDDEEGSENDDEEGSDNEDNKSSMSMPVPPPLPMLAPTPPEPAVNAATLTTLRTKLQEVFREDDDDDVDVLARLRAIEVELKLPSLLAAATQSASPMQLPVPNRGSPRTLLPQVESLVYQCRVAQHDFASPPSAPTLSLVTAAMAAELHLSSVPMAALASNQAPSTTLLFTHPLLAAAPTLPTLQRPIADIVSALKALPCLVDVESALGWSLHFAHEHGPFLAFFQHHVPHVPLLKLRSGAFVKLAATSTPASIAVTATTGDDMAVHITSMFTAMREACPWALIEAAIVSVLEQVPAPVDVALAALRRLPVDLVPHLGPHVLKSLATVVHNMPDQLWRAATHWSDQLRLAHLGVTASVPQWQAHLDAFLSSGSFAALPSVASSAPSTPVHTETIAFDAVATPTASIIAGLPSTAVVVATSEVPAVDVDACRSLVESIRRENFGIGLPVTPETQAFLKRQHQRLERALKRLSEELYATSTHFVLELIQNADDNTYAPGVSPRATFDVHDDAITFFCNEVGFQPSHVRALCDVGASTKASATGFIGQKGIGFKSVFTVTHAPEIHSNGYHLRFDANPQHDLGPDHVSYILPYWIDAPAFPDSQSGTTMHFPLHAQAKEQLPSTCALLEHIQPSILLFLRQLESLELTNEVLATSVCYRKTWTSPHLVTLHTSASASQQWYVAKRAIVVPKSNLREQVPQGASTLLQVAFPITDEHVASHPLQSVFAYLPLQSYGFRCILQADFEVPSSREAVLDSGWNQWLLLEFPSLFVDAFLDVVTTHPHLIRLLPLLHDVQPPFHVLAQDIGVRLQSKPIVQNAAGCWVPPTSVLDAMDLFGDDAPTPCDKVLRDVCQKDYLHPAFSAWLSPEMKRTLGIQALSSAHLVHIANSVHQSSLSTAYHGRLLVQLARLAHRERSTTAVAAQIQHAPLLPLAGDTKKLVTPASTVFLPTDAVSIAMPFASAIQLLAPEVCDQLQTTPIARAFALAAGVKPMSATDVLLHHVLPRAKAASKSHTDQQAVMAFLLAYAVAHELSAHVVSAIKESVSVRTTRGHLVPLSRQLYLVNPSLPDADAFDAFAMIDPAIYGEKAAAFFSTVLHVPVLLSLDTGTDNNVPGLDAIVAYAAATPSVPVATALLQFLDQSWRPAHASLLLSAIATLTAHAWVPVQRGSVVTLVRPTEAYVCPPSLPRRLRSHFSAVVVDVTNKALVTALQMHHGLSCGDLVHLLQSPLTSDADVHVIYQHLQTLLRDLSDADVATVRDAFASAPLVFAGDGSRRTLAQCVWKMPDEALPGLFALASVYPKTLKELFVRLGVPTHPTMVNVLAALASSAVDKRPHLAFLAAHWQDALPFKTTLDTLPFVQAMNGDMVTFGAGAYWTKGVPSWFDALALGAPLVDVASAVNAPFEALVQAWPTHNLEQAIVSAPTEWCARVAAVCANATVRESTKHALVLDVLQLFSDHNVALPETSPAIFPTQAENFVVLGDAHVLGGDDAPLPLSLPHPSLLALPYDVSLRNYLVAQGMPTLAYTTHVECDLTVPDEDGLRDFIARQVNRAALPPPPANAETWTTLLGRLRCSLGSSLVVEYAIDGAVVHRVRHASFLHDNRLYVEEPLNEYVVFTTLANHVYGPSSDLASSVANALFVLSMQPESAVPPLWSELPGATTRKRKHDWANPQALEAPSKRVRPSQGAMFQIEMPHAGPSPAYHPQRPLQLTDEMRMAIGRAGEAYVYEVLHASLGSRVEWINADEETGLPYDLCINHESGGREYIEVKATSTFDKLSFEMSVQELDFAAAHGSQYTIYRVFQVKPHVGAVVNCPIVKLRNPNTLLRQKKLKLSVVMDASVAAPSP